MTKGRQSIEVDANGGRWIIGDYSLVDASFHGIAEMLPTRGQDLLGLRCRVPPDRGVGWWDMLELLPGLHLIIVDAEYLADRTVVVPGDRRIKIRIILSGAMRHHASGGVIEGTGAFVEMFPGEVDSRYVLVAGMRTRMVIVSVSPERLCEELGIAFDVLPVALSEPFRQEMGAPEGSVTPLGPEVLRAANDIMRIGSHYSSHLTPAVLRAKCSEITCSMVQQMITPRETGPAAGLSVRDVSRIHEARDILLDQYARPPSIARLARLVGINQTKLKSSFKAVFGSTVYDFIQKCRMERATELLMTTPLSIAEIGYAVGFEYPANFTHAYKRFYGHLPRQVRRAQEPAEPAAASAVPADQ